MLELGQPLHAFDADTLHVQQIIVRRAGFDEKITTLDGVERKLDPSVLLIADKDHGVAVAGVMGGAETEISTGTANVLLESAAFNPLSIRKTSRAIGLSSEASYRFERGSDIEMARYACDRAAALIQELAGGTVYRGVIDVYPEKAKPNSHGLRRQRIEGFLGAPVDDKIVERIFERLEFKTTRNADGWTIEAPTHRVDIGQEEDLLEEIARHHGFDKFPMTLPEWNGFGAGLPWESQERRLRDALAASGYTEIYMYSFSDEATEQQYRPGAEPVKFQNPMTEDATILRTSLVPGILKTIQWNVNRGTRDLQLFELSKVYSKAGERRSLILAACGDLRPQGVHDAQRQFDFFDIKGDIETVMTMFGVEVQLTANDLPAYYHPGRSARVEDLATFGEVHPEYVEAFKLRQRVYIAEIDVETLMSRQRARSVRQPSRFPAVRRDFSLLVDKGTQYDAIHRTIAGIGIPELAGVAPFDRMETGSFAEGKYSLSISVLYQSAERTLTDAEVEGFDQKILQTLEQRVGAQLRK
jgi:phenylalanyl-tRNA synthetase beta chain